MHTWNRVTSTILTHTGNTFDLNLPENWREIRVKLIFNNKAADWGIYKRLTREDVPTNHGLINFALGAAGGWVATIKWLSILQFQLWASKTDGSNVGGTFNWEVEIIGL